MNYKEIRNYQRETLPLYTAMVIDPMSRYVVSIILKFDIKIKPYIYTYFGLMLSLISAYFFLKQNYLAAAIIFQISLIFDCIDGYIAKIQKNGSMFGIISDGIADFLRVYINLFAMFLSLNIDNSFINFFTLYLLFVICENTINVSLKDCKTFFKNRKLKQNYLDKILLKYKHKLEKKKLRLILFYYHERYFLIFFLAPLTGNIEFIVYLTLLISSIFLILKILLDISIIKMEMD